MSFFVGPRDKAIIKSVALANTNTTAVYTHAEQRAGKASVMFIANEAGSTKVALVYRYDASATTEYCIGGYSIDDDRSQTIDLYGFPLDESDELRVKADSGVDVTVIVIPFIAGAGQ